jgi:putative spermidine/putrescine transport system substrate-binding protein
LAGWICFARQGYYHTIPDNAKKYLEPAEWDYWYIGKPAAEDLPDPFGTIIIKKGDVRTGGSKGYRLVVERHPLIEVRVELP